ncbi:uncharacterized protein STEHIDRAFT_123539, partial [Stereum hirsutum FP-91666 SS1]|uniref:uncharacterized protein n=1 Tax=Stereum hirsutum (strain FP-91666) TaxID=721885 RepID=UPI0004449626
MPVNGGIPTTSEENTYDDPGELEVPSELTSITTLSTLLETQTQVLRQMLEKQDAVV